MKKILLVSIILLGPLAVFLIYNSQSRVEQNFDVLESVERGSSIIWNDTTYKFYGVLDDYSLKGEQIGIVDDDLDWKIYEFTNLSNRDWLIEGYNGFMNPLSIYKAVHVTEIPDYLMLD